MFQRTQSNGDLSPNYLQLHENAFVSPLNLINVTHPAPISFGRAPHILQQKTRQSDSSISPLPQLQSIDTNKLHMYQFLAQRKLKEDQRRKHMNGNGSSQQAFQQRTVYSSQSQQRLKNTPIRSTSALKTLTVPKKTHRNETNRFHVTPAPIHFSRPNDPYTALSVGKQNEITDIHQQLLVQLRILHNPPARENIIDETEQEKQRRIRLKRERIRRDSRAIYNAHQELKQILHDIHQSDANLPRLTHRHLNAYKAILLAAETLANEAPLKAQDTSIQQLFTAILPVLETLTNVNNALGLSQLRIDPTLFRSPPSKIVKSRTTFDNCSTSPNQLLPSIYKELIRNKQQQKRHIIPSVLRPRSAESVRLPRSDVTSITRPTISRQQKTRARSHSPLPSVQSASTIETPFYSRFTVDHILVKLAPRLLANYNGRELTEQIERARTLIPMFLVDNRLTDDEIVGRVIQMIMPRREHQVHVPTTDVEVFETSEERTYRANLDIYQTQISTWEEEMAQIRQRLQNYKTNRLERETDIQRTVKFQVDSMSPISLPENVHIHTPLLEHNLDDFVTQPTEEKQAFEKTTVQSSSRGTIRLNGLDSSKIRRIERYRKDYQDYLQRTESAKTEDFDPSQIINRLSEILLNEALLSVVNEVELLSIELSQKLVENELLGREISLADVEKEQRQQQQYRRPLQQLSRKYSPISPSPSTERYTSSFEEDINTESKRSPSEDDESTAYRKSPMEGTGVFTASAFEYRKPARTQVLSSSSSSSPSRTDLREGIIIKPIIGAQKSVSTYEEPNQYYDQDDFESSRSKTRPQEHQRYLSSGGDDDDEDEGDDFLLSTKTGEKIYSTDFDDPKSKIHTSSNYDDDDDADTMKLSARSINTSQRRSFDSDDD